MKNLVLALLAIIFVSTAAIANQSLEDGCRAFGEVGAAIMESRQNGESLRSVLYSLPEEIHWVAYDVYDVRREQTYIRQRRAVEFAHQHFYNFCMNALNQ